jgi:hypothetical protein
MDIVDMEDFKKIRKALKGSTTDTVILMQVISVIDYMADMVLDQQQEIDRLHYMLKSLEESMEE